MIRSADFWGGIFWFAFGTFIIWAGRDLGIGKVNDPGSGFALFWIGSIIVTFAAMIIVAAVREPGASVASLWTNTRWAKILVVVGLLVAYGFLFDTVGFVALSAIMLLILMFAIDPVRPTIAIPVALLAPYGVYYVVTKTLKIQMPAGVLAPWLG